MKSVLAWSDKIQEKDRPDQCVHDIVYKPDGSELLVAAGTRVLVYDGENGTLLQTLKGHKDTVYCVDYSHNGERFASGSADKSVIVWTEQHEGILKFNHNDALQRLAFNPQTPLLVSCGTTDFGLWSQDQKAVNKHKMSSRICSCSWSRDGQVFALGLYNGTVSVRLKTGEEKHKIERPNGAPVWSLKFNPNKVDDQNLSVGDQNAETLAIGDWNQTLSFYTADGLQIGKDKPLQYDPCALDYFTLGDYMVMGGSNRQLSLHTKDGIKLGTISDQESWVWCAKTKPQTQFVTLGCNDGTVACYQMIFTTVHGLHKDRYAYRDNMTDVIVQHLLTDKKVRIKCKDLVKKVAIYKTKLAIQLSDRLTIYELATDNDTDMNYKAKDRISQNLECSLLVVCARHIILCQEKRLQSYDFRGLKEREWVMEALIRYIKVIGGPIGRESLLVGLKNGQVLKIFVDNPFPVEILKIKNAVRCLDLSEQRGKLAIVDENTTCLVFDLRTNELLFQSIIQEPKANSVAWNTNNEDLLCFSGDGFLSIKAQNFPLYQQRLQGFVVGFTGSKVFCLHMYTMTAVEVPLSNQLYQFLEKKMHTEAYKVACLGVTEADWELLALDALESFEFNIAKKAFIRTRNIKFLELIQIIDDRRRKGESETRLFLAESLAYEGKLSEAASLFKQSGHEQKAMDMYTDMRMFDKAQELLSNSSTDVQKSLIRKRADWAKTSNEPKVAAEMYIAAGDYDRAIAIIGEHGWTDMLMGLVRKMDISQHESLKLCAKYFMEKKELIFAAEVYRKLGDYKALVQMYIGAQQWEDAFAVADQQPNLKDDVYLPYANWLAETDRFEEAQKAFHKAGRPDEAFRVLEQLTKNAVSENRFSDAGRYYWMLSMQYLERAGDAPRDKQTPLIQKHLSYQKLADMYYAYHAVHRYTDEPFTSYQPDALLNISRFLLQEIPVTVPEGISKVATLYTLAKQAKALGAYKLARHAFEKLQQLRAPLRFQSVIDMGALTVRSKPFHDAEELLPVCYRCSTTNPLLNTNGNICVHCKQPFVFSFVSFEVLPVVEFTTEEGISDTEAKELIAAEPPLVEEKGKSEKTPFTERLSLEEPKFTPLVLNRSSLLSLNRTEVVICEWPKPLRNQYYRNLIPEISITKCDSCNRLFQTDDFELQVLQEGSCPFCKRENENAKREFDDEALDFD